MRVRLIRNFATFLVTIWVVFAGTPAVAGNFAPGSVCYTYLAAGESRDSAEKQADRWTCDGSGWRIEGARAIVRFDLRNRASKPRYFITRLSDFDLLTLTAIGADGTNLSRSFTPKTMPAAQTIYQMYAPLPFVPTGATAVYADYQGPRYFGVITQATLSETAPVGQGSPADTLVTMLCGLLFWPLLFLLACFRVLKERFLLWYGLTGVMTLIYAATTGGVLARFVPLSAEFARSLIEWSLAIGVAGMTMFLANYVEPGKLDEKHFRWLRRLVLGSLSLAALDRFALVPATALQMVFYAGWIPIIAIYSWILVTALRRGSRAAVFVASAWAPTVLVGLYQVLGNLGFVSIPASFFVALFGAVTLEMIITAIGVADRFMTIKQDRDRARDEAMAMGELADRDSLTGLLNRRAAEANFEDLLASGFKTVALVDLDHFKTVNDTRGHAVGDSVLKVVAAVLTPDEDTLAVRLGGEEFMLLLRGKNAAEKAERLRTAIPTRIASQVPGLESLVTASVGLVELPLHGRLRCSFASLYSQCDRLLYEAKNTGRNRMMRERMQSFGETDARAAA